VCVVRGDMPVVLVKRRELDGALRGCQGAPVPAMIERVFDSPGLEARPTTSWPSPAEDYYDGPLSLDRALIRHPAATFLVRVAGDGLRSEGVLDGDVLVVDRSVDPGPGHVVVVVIEGQHRVGLLRPEAELVKQTELWDPSDPTAERWPASGQQPWGGAEGWCLGTDDLILPIPSGSVIFGVATHAVHHLPGTAYHPGRSSRPVPADVLRGGHGSSRAAESGPSSGGAP
jgi:hypothetical protein